MPPATTVQALPRVPAPRDPVQEPRVLSLAMLRQPAFWEGSRAYRPLWLGIASWGLMTGVAMTNSGLSLFEGLLMTLLVFAGTAQLAAIPLIAAGAPVWVVLAAAFCVNLRFVVFSAHLREYVRHLPFRERVLFGYLSGDINYVLFVQRYPHPSDEPKLRGEQIAWYVGSTATNYVAWCTPCTLGVLVAQALPLSWGLGFAGTLAVLGVLCATLDNRMRILATTLAGGVAVLAWNLPLKLNLVAAIVVSVAVCLALEYTVLRRSSDERDARTEARR